MTQIECKNISIGYDKNAILSNLSFSIENGDYLCILGENGAGKSTLMKTILGLIPIISGKIEFENGLTKKDIGYLPQQTIVQKDFPATCYEIVISGFQNRCGLRPFYNKTEKQKALDIMKEIGIEKLKNKCFRELSGGQKQRVLLARALCSTQKILLLDEPVSGLDPKATEEMYEIIDKLNKNGITVIMISHDVSSALKYAKHILFVNNNPFFGTKEEFENSDLGKQFEKYAGGHIGGHQDE